jgi:hypothetical protein
MVMLIDELVELPAASVTTRVYVSSVDPYEYEPYWKLLLHVLEEPVVSTPVAPEIVALWTATLSLIVALNVIAAA